MHNMKKVEKEYIELYGDVSPYNLDRTCSMIDEYSNKRTRAKREAKLNDLLNISWESVSFIIYLIPQATPRPRYNGGSKIFYVRGAKDNRDIFEKFIVNQDIPMITTPCKFYCDSYFPIPKSMRDDEKILAEMGYIRPITKPDWDNVGKTYSDMIQGTLLFDDSLIIEGTSRKFYSAKPRIEIKIEYMKNHDSIYNTNKMRKKGIIDE